MFKKKKRKISRIYHAANKICSHEESSLSSTATSVDTINVNTLLTSLGCVLISSFFDIFHRYRLLTASMPSLENILQPLMPLTSTREGSNDWCGYLYTERRRIGNRISGREEAAARCCRILRGNVANCGTEIAFEVSRDSPR